MSLADLFALLRFALLDPVDGARRFIALRLPLQALWAGFGAMIAVAVILASLTYSAILVAVGADLPPEVVNMLLEGTSSPLVAAILHGILMLASVHALDRIGRRFGGTGDFAGALTVTVVMGFFYNALAALQLAVLLLFPLALPFAAIGALGYILWLAPGLVMGLHGFTARLPVLVVMIVTFLALNFALAFLGALILGGRSDV